MYRLGHLLLITIFFFCCNGADHHSNPDFIKEIEETQVKERPFQNVIILLDLSSRIEKAGQIVQDKQIIKTILDVFEKNQKAYVFMTSKDKLIIELAFQANSNSRVNDSLVLDMQKGMNKPIFNKEKAIFKEAVENLYQQAANSPTPGADIWGFMCEEFPRKYNNKKINKIIIITDGYLLFDNNITQKRPKGTYMSNLNKLRGKSDWKRLFEKYKMELTPCEQDISNSEVLMIEIDPRNKDIATNELDILEHYWKTWFDKMGVKSSFYPIDDRLEMIQSQLENFLEAN